MSEESKVLEGIGQYKFGFHDAENYVFRSQRGLSREVVENISSMKGEPQWMLDFRLKALAHFLARPMPTWGADISGLNLDNIFYYVKPTEGSTASWDDVPDTIKNTFDKLGIPEAERKFLAGVGAQYESEMVYHSILEHLEKQGVIFLSIEDGLRQQVCSAELGGLVGWIFCLCAERDKGGFAPPSLFPAEHSQCGSIRTLPDHCR
jgi:Fe-S cluster assembly protein SufB